MLQIVLGLVGAAVIVGGLLAFMAAMLRCSAPANVTLYVQIDARQYHNTDARSVASPGPQFWPPAVGYGEVQALDAGDGDAEPVYLPTWRRDVLALPAGKVVNRERLS